ncbi:uncharacterized mitochondrial protein AtMg00240-like [Vigna umbellata]|uniref:uncharacterized mitochondrial protein AtMg00240-like n=1 Tax=Vigna umbellata TaxID=87088 RepID=UPI001F5F3612|nr:uncharacterized mitochondrial protein AtMg00240-like [Vigna umbellata]
MDFESGDLLQGLGDQRGGESKSGSFLGTKFSKTEGKPYSDVHAYRRLLDRLLYLTNTRPNLCFAISTLSPFLSNPLEDHYAATIRILRYIKNNPGQGLFFPSNTEHALKAFSDSDWNACPDTKRFVTGFNVFYGASLISWKSKKQGIISRS